MITLDSLPIRRRAEYETVVQVQYYEVVHAKNVKSISTINAGSKQCTVLWPVPQLRVNPLLRENHMLTKVFRGKYGQGAITRTESFKDPATGKTSVTRRKLDVIEGLVLATVTGLGQFSNTGEDYVTVTGQYAPGKTSRITASAQNMQLLSEALLKDNVDKSAPRQANGQIKWPLKKEHVVKVIGTPMQGFGLLVEEVYLTEGKDEIPVIAAPEQPAAQELGEMFF